jgi:hypothetical protein
VQVERQYDKSYKRSANEVGIIQALHSNVICAFDPSNRSNFFVSRKTKSHYVLRKLYWVESELFAESFVNGFCPILYVKLFVDLVNVYANGTGCDLKLMCDFFVQ